MVVDRYSLKNKCGNSNSKLDLAILYRGLQVQRERASKIWELEMTLLRRRGFGFFLWRVLAVF
jgi:hypothetical protein